MDMEFMIFKGKSFQDLCQDIYSNQVHRKEQLEILINDLRKMCQKIDDAPLIIPLIKSYIDAANINDQHLIRLASIIQKLMIVDQQNQSSENMMFSDEERKAMMAEVDKELESIAQSDAIIVKTIENTSKKP